MVRVTSSIRASHASIVVNEFSLILDVMQLACPETQARTTIVNTSIKSTFHCSDVSHAESIRHDSMSNFQANSFMEA
jgi:hypothetical protein